LLSNIILCLYFFIWPSLEARAEICQIKRFTFWEISRHQNFILRLTDLKLRAKANFIEATMVYQKPPNVFSHKTSQVKFLYPNKSLKNDVSAARSDSVGNHTMSWIQLAEIIRNFTKYSQIKSSFLFLSWHKMSRQYYGAMERKQIF
jgi:hypothetical protein